MKTATFFLTMALAIGTQSEDLVLRVNAGSGKWLGVPPVDDCTRRLGPTEIDEHGNVIEPVCWQYRSWIGYTADVIDVIRGEHRGPTVQFAVYSHGGFSDEYKKGLIVHLKELDVDRANYLKTTYYAEDYASPEEVACFRGDLPRTFSDPGFRDGDRSCYYLQDLYQ